MTSVCVGEVPESLQDVETTCPLLVSQALCGFESERLGLHHCFFSLHLSKLSKNSFRNARQGVATVKENALLYCRSHVCLQPAHMSQILSLGRSDHPFGTRHDHLGTGLGTNMP